MLFERIVTEKFKAQLYLRSDDMGTAYYFSAADFPGLAAEPFVFHTPSGNRLQGYFYSYENPRPDRLVVFEHGMGGGHRSYMKEIERLARAGFLVLGYDHTGCMESEGKNIGGFAGSLSDLDACLHALKAAGRTAGRTVSVVGHSWGGFSTLNIGALHPELRHLVAIAGFRSVEAMLGSVLGGPLKFYRPALLKLERENNPGYTDYKAEESLRRTDAHLLVLHAADDKMVPYAEHFEPLREALKDRPNSRFERVDGRKGHNPNYTADAVQYKDGYLAELAKRQKEGTLVSGEQKAEFLASFDWERMTAQDDAVWVLILETLNKE